MVTERGCVQVTLGKNRQQFVRLLRYRWIYSDKRDSSEPSHPAGAVGEPHGSKSASPYSSGVKAMMSWQGKSMPKGTTMKMITARCSTFQAARWPARLSYSRFYAYAS